MSASTLRVLAAVLALECSSASATNPVNKVVQMLSDLEAKIINEGMSAQKVYEEFSEWCEERSRTLGHEIQTGNDEVASLKAAIAKETADSSALTTRIEELTAELAKDTSDLEAAKTIRSKEAGVCANTEKDLLDTTDTLERAIRIIEKEMNKGGASMLQMQNANNLVQVLSTMVDASAISSADESRLNAFIQSSSSDDDMGAPAGSVYESQSGNILDTLNSLLEKAQDQLGEARKTETSNQHNFDQMRQGLEDEISYGKKELAEAKKGLAGSAGEKATAEGDLDVTSKDLADDIKAKSGLHQQCMTTAQNFEAETRSRGEELKALREAKKVIAETTTGATSISYSFLQTESRSEISSSASLANFEAVRIISDLARKDNSPALAQLAKRMRVAMHSGAADTFGKVKNLIRDMISKLEEEAEADASRKAWCDRNLADANQRKSEKIAEIAKLTTRIDSKAARSAQLKEEIAELQNGLAKLAASQVSMNKIRKEENAAYVSNKADMEQGLEGVKMALKILGEYYASEAEHAAAQGAGDSIIGLLEVVESDFSKSLAEIEATEESAVNAYEQQTKENEIEKTTKDQDVRYKTKEAKHLDKDSAELSTDRVTVQAELDATNKLLSQLDTQCIDKAETYEQQTARRAAEIAGLKEALQILNEETAFVQKSSLRATRRHK